MLKTHIVPARCQIIQKLLRASVNIIFQAHVIAIHAWMVELASNHLVKFIFVIVPLDILVPIVSKQVKVSFITVLLQ